MVTISRGIVTTWAGGGDALRKGFVLQQCNKRVVFGIGWFLWSSMVVVVRWKNALSSLCVWCPNRLSGTVDLVAACRVDNRETRISKIFGRVLK